MARFQVVTDPGSFIEGRLLDQHVIFEVDDNYDHVSRTWRPLDEGAVALLKSHGVAGAVVMSPITAKDLENKGKVKGPVREMDPDDVPDLSQVAAKGAAPAAKPARANDRQP